MSLIRNAVVLLIVAATPVGTMAQQEPTARLLEVLPADVATDVVAIVAEARELGLPEHALANHALEGVAKGRTGQEVLAAVRTMSADLGRAHDAIRAGGRAPGAGEVEAAAIALRMGVDGEAIRELARTHASGASLAVPMMVLGNLTERGLPSDAALAQVRERLGADRQDAPGGRMTGPPEGMGPDSAPGLAGFQVPVSGLNVPVGPPEDRGRPDDVPGRGRPGGAGRPQGPPGGPPGG